MKKTVFFLFVLSLLFVKNLGCNSYYGGYGGLFGDYGYGYNGHGPVHMNAHTHGYGPYGYGQAFGQGFGGFMNSLLRTDIGGGHHHHHHRPLIPIAHHRHVHHVGRRSTHFRRSRTTST